MQRKKLAFVMLLCLLTTSLSFGANPKTSKKTVKKAAAKPLFTLNFALPPGMANLKQQYMSYKAGGGGFRCYAIHVVEFHVSKGNDKVTVKPNKVTIQQGECVQWVAKKDDNSDDPTIDLIDFIDTSDEASAANKMQNNPPAGDQCANNGRVCTVVIGLPEATYRYMARVHHDGHQKKSDPELEVLCTGCGEP